MQREYEYSWRELNVVVTLSEQTIQSERPNKMCPHGGLD